jgi:hypothetical protein
MCDVSHVGHFFPRLWKWIQPRVPLSDVQRISHLFNEGAAQVQHADLDNDPHILSKTFFSFSVSFFTIPLRY